MANINSLMSSSSSAASNLYGTRNVLSGLASGMDTEAMIENSVSGYKTKVTQLQQQQTKYEWKQDAYRSISDKMYELTQKYASYTSKTNLFSNSFFSNSVVTTAVGPTDAVAQVSAKGRSSSDVQILAAQAATAYRYDVSSSVIGLNTPGMTARNVTDTAKGAQTVGTLNGYMRLNYDGQNIDINFDESDTDINDDASLVEAIRQKLSETNITTAKNGVMKASDVIKVSAEGGKITFSENTDNNKQGATPYLSYVDSKLAEKLGATKSELYKGSGVQKYTLSSNVQEPFSKSQSIDEYLNGKTINVTVDGVSKSFTLKGLEKGADNAITMDSLKKAFEDGLSGTGIEVKLTDDEKGLAFSSKNATSNISISAADSKVNELLGMGSGLGNYIDTSSSLKTLLEGKFNFTQEPVELDADVEKRLKKEDDPAFYTDRATGDRYKKAGDDYYRVNDKGDPLYELKINDKSVYVAADSSLDSVLTAINSSDMGVNATYSKLTGKFVLTAKELGASGNISFDSDLAKKLFAPDIKTSEITLGDALGEDWFTNGDINLHVSYPAGYGELENPIDLTYHEGDSVVDFLKAFNAASRDVQFADNLSQLDSNGHNISDTFEGGGLTVKATGDGEIPNDDAFAGTFLITNPDTGKSMTLQEFADLINRFTPSGVKGEDAQVRVMVNGEVKTLQRASNTIDMDGMTVTLKGDFGNMSDYKNADAATVAQLDKTNKANAVSFTTSGSSDDMIKTIRDFVDDYNAIMKQVHDAYATQPAEKSSSTHAKYEPLTDDDKASMSESAVKAYEDKAKQGILFGDSDLRNLYQKMMNAIAPGGSDGATLREIGIESSYSGGMTLLKLDESKLRSALDTDPDKVRNAFTKSKEYGASTEGLMSSIKKTMEQYASTSIASPGVLVKKAGSTFSSTSLLNNAMQTQIDNVQTQIEKWQSKMGTKIDYYTRQFTALEKLMNTMNSQSSALSGLMGGY